MTTPTGPELCLCTVWYIIAPDTPSIRYRVRPARCDMKRTKSSWVLKNKPMQSMDVLQSHNSYQYTVGVNSHLVCSKDCVTTANICGLRYLYCTLRSDRGLPKEPTISVCTKQHISYTHNTNHLEGTLVQINNYVVVPLFLVATYRIFSLATGKTVLHTSTLLNYSKWNS